MTHCHQAHQAILVVRTGQASSLLPRLSASLSCTSIKHAFKEIIVTCINFLYMKLEQKEKKNSYNHTQYPAYPAILYCKNELDEQD
jgi:hypothetical protein